MGDVDGRQGWGDESGTTSGDDDQILISMGGIFYGVV